MMRALTTFKSYCRSFARDESGTGTLEFVMVLPGFLLLFFAAAEGGLLATRQVVLEHGLDRAVREVRVGRVLMPTHASLISQICSYASAIPDCSNQIRLEMIPMNPSAWVSTDITEKATCRNRAEDDSTPLNAFSNTGTNNELMILRVCALFDPLIPTSGIGRAIPKESGDAYALIAMSSYVMEPFQ